MHAQPNILTIAILASAFKLVHADDAAAGRAADNALKHLQDAPVLAFDPTELRIASQSQQDGAGAEYVADATGCTCKGTTRPWCKHRASYRLLLAELALRDPAALIRLVLEQASCADSDPAEIAPAPRVAAVIAEIADEAAYMDALMATEPEAPADAWLTYHRRRNDDLPDYIAELYP